MSGFGSCILDSHIHVLAAFTGNRHYILAMEAMSLFEQQNAEVATHQKKRVLSLSAANSKV